MKAVLYPSKREVNIPSNYSRSEIDRLLFRILESPKVEAIYVR